MDKIYFTGGIKTVNDPVWGVLRLLQEKENEIVGWINEHGQARGGSMTQNENANI